MKKIEDLIQQWIHKIYTSKVVEYRKFYNTKSLYEIYKTSDYYSKPKPGSKKGYLIRAFTRTLNNVSDRIPTFKYKHVRDKGYLYIFVYPHEQHMSISSLRLSSRKSDEPTVADIEQEDISSTNIGSASSISQNISYNSSTCPSSTSTCVSSPKPEPLSRSRPISGEKVAPERN